MLQKDIPKDYDFKNENKWENKWADENIYKFKGFLFLIINY